MAQTDQPLPVLSSDVLGAGAEARCWCRSCRPMSMADMRMILCPDCGCKRCPKATSHKHACTDSNDAGQIGSEYGRGLCARCVTPRVCTKDQNCYAGCSA